jgi:hypothetical protein
MSSSYTTSLQIQLIGNGEQSGVWGTTTNTNWNLIEQSVAGVVNITMTNANYTLSIVNGASDESRNMVLFVGGTNSAIRQVIAPLVSKVYMVYNNTSGGYAITIGGATGAIATIPNGVATLVFCDGTNFYGGVTGTSGAWAVNGICTATSFTGAGTGLTGTATSLSIGGNAATATLATSATSATQANSASSLQGASYSIIESGGKLVIKYGTTTIASIDSSGNFTSLANITAYGTP